MKGLLAFMLLLLSAAVSPAALAQDVNGQSSGGVQISQPMASSLGALLHVLRVGQEITVRDEFGRTEQGRLEALSADELVISRPRWWSRFSRRTNLMFQENVIRRIEIVDSLWNGALLGATPGVVAVVASCAPQSASNLCGVVPFFVVAIGLPVGMAIDATINKRIFERPFQTPRITLAPLLGEGRRGVVARIDF